MGTDRIVSAATGASRVVPTAAERVVTVLFQPLFITVEIYATVDYHVITPKRQPDKS